MEIGGRYIVIPTSAALFLKQASENCFKQQKLMLEAKMRQTQSRALLAKLNSCEVNQKTNKYRGS